MSYRSLERPNVSHLYAVVEFPNEGSCQVIQTSWLIKDNAFCIYPKVDSFRMTRLVRDRILPPKPDTTDNYSGKDVWEEHCVRILTYTDSYEKGRQKAVTAEYTSNVESEDNQDRLRKRARYQNIPHQDISTDDEKAHTSQTKRRTKKTNVRTSNQNRKQVQRKLFINDNNRGVQPLILPPHQPLIGSLTNPTLTVQPAIPCVGSNAPSFILAPGSGRMQPISPLLPSQTLKQQKTPHISPSAERAKIHPSTGNRSDLPFPHSNRQAIDNCCDYNSPTSRPHHKFVRPSTVSSPPTSIELEENRTPGGQAESSLKFQSLVLRNFSVIQQDLQIIKSLLSVRSQVTETLPNTLPVTLPLNSIADFNAVNEWLSSSSHHDQLVNQLTLIGGSSLETIVRGILMKLVGPLLNNSLNFSGKFDKTKLKGTCLHYAILDSVRKNDLGRNATDEQIKLCIQKWLNGSKDRDGGRNRRRSNEVSSYPPAPRDKSV